MYKDINNKTGFTNLQGNNFLYGNMKLLNTTDYQTALATKNSLYNDVIDDIDLTAVSNISIPVSWEQPTEDI